MQKQKVSFLEKFQKKSHLKKEEENYIRRIVLKEEFKMYVRKKCIAYEKYQATKMLRT